MDEGMLRTHLHMMDKWLGASGSDGARKEGCVLWCSMKEWNGFEAHVVPVLVVRRVHPPHVT